MASPIQTIGGSVEPGYARWIERLDALVVTTYQARQIVLIAHDRRQSPSSCATWRSRYLDNFSNTTRRHSRIVM